MANRKRNIAFARPEEPEFIKKLKIRAGITRGPDIDTKSEELPKAEREDLEDNDEEQPVIVVLKKGDLTEEEFKQMNEQHKTKQEELDIEEGRITFKKPDKSDDSDKNIFVQSTTKKNNEKLKKRIEENNVKSVKNSSLLSFDDEEEDQESD